MSEETRDRRAEDAGQIRWVEGSLAAIALGIVLFGLYFLVPRLQVYWANFGITPPVYGRVLISMTQHTLEIAAIGLVLVVLIFRRRG